MATSKAVMEHKEDQEIDVGMYTLLYRSFDFLSIDGHQRYILASDFVFVTPKCPSCNSCNIAVRPWGGTTTRDPHIRQPRCSESSVLFEL